MKLRRIDILGFKSFRTRTGLEIHDGVTAVVGPNGCGKSNIVDAIRWAIGSQSPKDLRGRAMEDVIFAGSEHHKPLSVAEVSLTLDSDGRDVPIEWQQHAEIRVTRRLFRTGESEYEINGVRARLRDIQQLFLGTGVGAKEAYSIIEQGRIGFLVSARPEERRLIIEEAAGITRYKFQRQSAQRRLEKTRENLVRVDDVLGEVDRQLASLQRQAKRAAKARELGAERRALDIRAALDRRDRAAASRDEARKRLEAASQRAEICRASLSTAEGRLATARAERQVEEHALAAATEEAYQARARRDLLSNGISHLEREKADLVARGEQIDVRKASASSLAEEATRERENARAALERVTRDKDALRTREAKLALEHTEARADEELLTKTQDAAASAASDAMARQEVLRARVEAARSELDALGVRASEAREERTVVEARALAAAEEAAHCEQVVGKCALALEEAERQLAATREARGAAREMLSIRERDASDARAVLVSLEHQLRALDGLIRRGEAFPEGVRQALEAVDSGELSGVGRPVIERLRVDRADEARLASVLGPYLDALVADDLDSARRLVEWARERTVDVSVCWGEPTGDSLANWVRVAAPIPAPVAALLENSVTTDVVRGGVGAVSPEGDAARRGENLIVVARPSAEAATSARLAAEREALLESTDAARQDVTAACQRLVDAERSHSEARGALERAQTLVDQCAAAHRSARAKADEVRVAASSHERTAQQLGRTLEDVLRRTDEIRGRIDRTREEQALAEVEAKALAVELENSRSSLPDVRARARAASDALSAARQELAGLTERGTALESTIRRGAETLERTASDRISLEAERRRVADRQAEIEDTLAGDRRSLEAAERVAGEAAERVARAKARAERVASAHLDLETALSAARRAASEAESLLRESELAAERAAADVGHAEADLAERFEITVDGARAVASGREFGSGERARLRAVEQELERLGPVNPAAEDEFAEASERQEFLRTQKTDLETAMADLEAAVRKMDRASRELFKSTFEEIDTRFRALFPKLFEGGRAHLEMTDPADLLETGIEIVVQPPGKRLQAMTLLSGGEKALTAVALVFSIFQLKPTPFCILDEVDAPLDDANVARFAETVRQMSTTSQFLLITHNKRTMEVAGTLYGVTMEEAGVSKIVGVRMPVRDSPTPAVAGSSLHTESS